MDPDPNCIATDPLVVASDGLGKEGGAALQLIEPRLHARGAVLPIAGALVADDGADDARGADGVGAQQAPVRLAGLLAGRWRLVALLEGRVLRVCYSAQQHRRAESGHERRKRLHVVVENERGKDKE